MLTRFPPLHSHSKNPACSRLQKVSGVAHAEAWSRKRVVAMMRMLNLIVWNPSEDGYTVMAIYQRAAAGLGCKCTCFYGTIVQVRLLQEQFANDIAHPSGC